MKKPSPYTLLKEIENLPACQFCKEVAWKQEYKHGEPVIQCINCGYRFCSLLFFKIEGVTLKELTEAKQIMEMKDDE